MAIDYPASPTHGQVYLQYIYDSTIPGWRNANSSEGIGLQFKSGLVPVVPVSINISGGSGTVSTNGMVTVSGTSYISLNGVFTSAYRNYRVQFHWGNTSASDNMFMNPRNAGTNATNMYYQGNTASQGGATGNSYSNAVAFWHISGHTAASTTVPYAMFTGDIIAPYLSTARTMFNGQGMGIEGGAWTTRNVAGWHDTAQSSDSLYLYSQSGSTFSGQVKVYGYN